MAACGIHLTTLRSGDICDAEGGSPKTFLEAVERKRQGVGVREIARRLDMRRATLIAWLKQARYEEGRGSAKGTLRNYTPLVRDRVITLKQARLDQPKYFLGSPHIQRDYAKRYPKEERPSLWCTDESVRRAGLPTRAPKQRTQGQDIVQRHRFPIKTIVGWGRIQQACDFIGKKYILGAREPISVFSTSYCQGFECYQIYRVLAEILEEAVEPLARFWIDHPIPQVMRIDNATAFRGAIRHVAVIGRFLKFLLNSNVTPLFAAPWRSYTHPHIEGHNRTFTEKLWARHTFTPLDAIDAECARFHAESEEFFRFKFAERLRAKGLHYHRSGETLNLQRLTTPRGKRIGFIRFVESWKERNAEIGIVVRERFIDLPGAYLNQYVFALLDLAAARLRVYSEVDGQAMVIRTSRFPYDAGGRYGFIPKPAAN
ncbi:MAG: transposase family protein [Gammaproteobacteria bacterium]